MTAFTADLGRFVAGLTLLDIPEKGRENAKIGMADCYGVMVAGTRDPIIKLVDDTMKSTDNKEQASLIPSGEKRNVDVAALVNGVASHVLDYDDVSLDGHPSAVLTPAILAQAEVSQSSGAEMVAAYVAGFEVWGELVAREPLPLHSKGWHPTCARGAVGAAAACAKLRRLDAAKTTTAIALAGSMAAGLMSNFGTMTKSFQVGRAAQSGVLAAKLAEAGLTASHDALEHRSGYLMAFSPGGKPNFDLPFDAKNKTWHILSQGLNIKRYPICYATHRSIDAALDLIQTNNLKPDDVAKIHIHTGQFQALMLRNARPQTGLEAKFSMQFAMASALVARKVGLAQLTDEFVLKPEVQAIFPRVSLETTTEIATNSPFAPTDQVEMKTVNGQTFKSQPIADAKGSYQKPLSRDELWEKFDECLGSGFAEPAKSRAFDNLMKIDRLNGTGDLSLGR